MLKQQLATATYMNLRDEEQDAKRQKHQQPQKTEKKRAGPLRHRRKQGGSDDHRQQKNMHMHQPHQKKENRAHYAREGKGQNKEGRRKNLAQGAQVEDKQTAATTDD